MWKVEWKSVGQGGMYLFSLNGVAVHGIAHRQCDTDEKFNAWVMRFREEDWWNERLYKEFRQLYKDGKKFQQATSIYRIAPEKVKILMRIW